MANTNAKNIYKKIHLHPCIWQVLRIYEFEMWLQCINMSKYLNGWEYLINVQNVSSGWMQQRYHYDTSSVTTTGVEIFYLSCWAYLPLTLHCVQLPREQGWEYTKVSHPNAALPHTLRLLTSPGSQILTFLSTSIFTFSVAYTFTSLIPVLSHSQSITSVHPHIH